ncbi:hypothetical protein SDC9_109821 [bioreactor metagenome]|uniref:Uncharacterized protein n=1 Tax=bioreactor metagenome TaxID=1076179 RepID=A0A645BIB8_9ZZZZ
MHRFTLAALGLGAVDTGEHVHAQRLSLVADQAADTAVAHHADGLSLKLKTLGIGLLLPFLLPHGVARNGEVPGAGEQQRNGQLGHGVGGGPGRVLHLNARLFRVFHGDVVHADAGPDDELQTAALGGIDLRLLDFGGAADDHNIKIPQSRTQLVGLIKLLDDLKAVQPQLLHCAGIHTVCNQNSHN